MCSSQRSTVCTSVRGFGTLYSNSLNDSRALLDLRTRARTLACGVGNVPFLSRTGICTGVSMSTSLTRGGFALGGGRFHLGTVGTNVSK